MSDKKNWWDDLTPAQMERYGAMIDSRVRLLGEYYGTAVERVRESDTARTYVLGVLGVCSNCGSDAPHHLKYVAEHGKCVT